MNSDDVQLLNGWEEVGERNRQSLVRQVRGLCIWISVLTCVVIGILIGTVYGARQAIRRNAIVMQRLHEQVAANQSLIAVMEDDRNLEQQRYQALLAAVETLRRSVERKR